MMTSAAIDVDFSGEWIGLYNGSYDEVIRIEQHGDQIEAFKITGNEYVPAGVVSWRANLLTGDGEGQVAEYEYRNARFVPGRLTVVDRERIVFSWDACGEVEYRRDD